MTSNMALKLLTKTMLIIKHSAKEKKGRETVCKNQVEKIASNKLLPNNFRPKELFAINITYRSKFTEVFPENIFFSSIEHTRHDSIQCCHNRSLCISLKHQRVQASHVDHICTPQGRATTQYHNSRRCRMSEMAARFLHPIRHRDQVCEQEEVTHFFFKKKRPCRNKGEHTVQKSRVCNITPERA